MDDIKQTMEDFLLDRGWELHEPRTWYKQLDHHGIGVFECVGFYIEDGFEQGDHPEMTYGFNDKTTIEKYITMMHVVNLHDVNNLMQEIATAIALDIMED